MTLRRRETEEGLRPPTPTERAAWDRLVRGTQAERDTATDALADRCDKIERLIAQRSELLEMVTRLGAQVAFWCACAVVAWAGLMATLLWAFWRR